MVDYNDIDDPLNGFKTIYRGDAGPFFYDPTEEQVPVADATDDTLADATLQTAVRTSGLMRAEEDYPTDPDHVTRLIDIGGYVIQVAVSPTGGIDAPDLSTYVGLFQGSLLIVTQTVAGTNEYTIYAWDNADSGGVASPYVVAGSSGFWVAVAGKYQKGNRTQNGNLIVSGSLAANSATFVAPLPITSGGTASSTANTAFNALAPSTVLGDTIYFGAGVNTFLAGNTTATRKFMRQVGDGAISAAPVWDTLVAGDIPSLSSVYQPLDADLTSLALLTAVTGDIIYGSAAGVWSKLADVAVGSVLVSGGVTTAPAWSTTPQVLRMGLGVAADGTTPLKLIAASATQGVVVRETDDGNDAVRLGAGTASGTIDVLASGSIDMHLVGNSASYLGAVGSGTWGIGTATADTDLLMVNKTASAAIGGIISVANKAAAAVGNSAAVRFKPSSGFTSGFWGAGLRDVMTNSSTLANDLVVEILYPSTVECMRFVNDGQVRITGTTPAADRDTKAEFHLVDGATGTGFRADGGIDVAAGSLYMANTAIVTTGRAATFTAVTNTGLLSGEKVSYCAGLAAATALNGGASPSFGYMTVSGVALSATKGITMLSAGSIVGITTTYDVTAKLLTPVLLMGAQVIGAAGTVTSVIDNAVANDKTATATASRGAQAFTAGQTINLFMENTAAVGNNVTVANVVFTLIVYFD